MKNIVWLVSYPKSGNTWFRAFLANYLKNSLNPVPLDELQLNSIASNAIDFEEIVALNPFELNADEVDLYRPDMYRTLSVNAAEREETDYKKAHDAYTLNKRGEPLFPENISKCAVYFIRNPLDVCISYTNHCSGSVEEIVSFILKEEATLAGKRNGQLRQILMSWKSHVQTWKKQQSIPVHFVRFEDMVQDPAAIFRTIIHFLELPYNQQRLERAILNSNFKKLQEMEEEKGFGEKMQSCKQFFWKGKTGTYREYLSQEQINRIVNYSYDTMKEFGYIDEDGNLTV